LTGGTAPARRAGIACPGCDAPMRALDLGRKPHGQVTVDLCGRCRGLWFDAFESVQLTPEATLALLREVAAVGDAPAPAARPAKPACPRCRRVLAPTQDVQRTTRFTYWRCAAGHGRFTPFVQFLREKDYVRPLDADEIARLRAHVGTVRCSGCGAPVDLGRDAACRYCGARVEVLDPDAVRRAIAAPRSERPVPSPPAVHAIDAWLGVPSLPARGAAGTTDLVVGGLAALVAALADRG
jgi:hypothetical protein